MKELFLVFLGGGAGSVCRYLASLLIGRNIASAFPWPTLSVNLLGCLLIGLLYTLSERCSLAQEYRLLLTVGLCGGFTTFSTFSNEALHLLHSGMHWQLPATSAEVLHSGLLECLPDYGLEEKSFRHK